MKVHKLKLGDLVYFPEGAAFDVVSGKVLEVLDIKADRITLRFGEGKGNITIDVGKDYMERAKRVLYKERFRKLKVGDRIMALADCYLLSKGNVVTVTRKYHGDDIGFDFTINGASGTMGARTDIMSGNFMAVKVK